MKFTWDEAKNTVNRKKHGIDSADVPAMFEQPMVTFLDQRKAYGKDRWIGIGWLQDVFAVIVFTEPDAKTIRVITARKANRHEQSIYTDEIRN